jgi:hypothetical protein
MDFRLVINSCLPASVGSADLSSQLYVAPTLNKSFPKGKMKTEDLIITSNFNSGHLINYNSPFVPSKW